MPRSSAQKRPTTLQVRVQPRSSTTGVRGRDDSGRLRISLKSPPVDGAANKELLRFLGKKILGVPPSSLRILVGKTSPNKTVAVEGLTAEALDAILSAL